MADEKITIKQQWYDLEKYKDEIANFVKNKKIQLDVNSKQEALYNKFYASVFAGTEESQDNERFPHMAELFKVYKSAILESSLSGYSALFGIQGDDGYSTLKIPELRKAMLEQFKGMDLLERLSGDYVDDWILKGETAAFLKYKETKEEWRMKQTVEDIETGTQLMSFTLKEGVNYENIDLERIDPFDIFIDAIDYEKDPLGCAKVIRSYIDAKTLLTSNAYPLLSQQDKQDILVKVQQRNGSDSSLYFTWDIATDPKRTVAKSNRNQIEVLTFYGDYITDDYKVLSNIKAVIIDGRTADVRYNESSTPRIIYAAYKVDRQTHRGISPLCSGLPINRLVNKATDLFIKNLDDVANPIMMWQKGTFNRVQAREARKNRELEFTSLESKPEFFGPPQVSQNGIPLIQMLLDENKAMLGLNSYMAGDSTGAVRTAQESAILFQKANARMRVETDVFSYRFMLPLFTSFYALNRELALAFEHPLRPIYADPQLKVTISTNAAKADKEGELQRLMQMLNLPIAQMIFSNLSPQQVILAVRYLMAKADLDDADNLLELTDSETGETSTPPPDAIDTKNSRGNPQDEEYGGDVSPETDEVPQDIPQDVSIDNLL